MSTHASVHPQGHGKGNSAAAYPSVKKQKTKTLPFLKDIETLAVIDTSHENLVGASTVYDGEDVAFRDTFAPWEKEADDLRRANRREEIMATLVNGIRAEAESMLDKAIRDMYLRYIDIFDTSVRSTPANVPPMELNADEEVWRDPKRSKNQGPPRPISTPLQFELERQIRNLLDLNVIRRCQQPHYSQALLVNKPGPPPQAKRLCIDYRTLNMLLEGMGWPLPNIQELLRRVLAKKPRFFTKIDYTSGYWQVSLAERSRWLTAFRTFSGVYEWLRVPMGIKCAGSYYQQQMATGPLAGLMYENLELYIDDILIFADSEEQLLERMEIVFQRFREFNCTIHPGKIISGAREIEFVGHLISESGLRFTKEKLQGVRDFPLPLTKKHLKSFLGLASYFRDHVRGFAMIARPLQDEVGSYAKTERNARVIWTPPLEEAFDALRTAVDQCATLHYMEDGMHDPIYLDTDASNYGIGAYLYQVRDGKDYPTMFISKSLNKTQLNWSVPEKEGYAIFYALVKMEHLLRDVPFTLLTDHENLTRIYSTGSQKVLRWRLFIQEFNMKLIKIPGEFNVVADAFSRLCPIKNPLDTDVDDDIAAIWEDDRIRHYFGDFSNDYQHDDILACITDCEIIARIASTIDTTYAENAPTTASTYDPDASSEEVPMEVTPPGAYDSTILEGRERTQALGLRQSSNAAAVPPVLPVPPAPTRAVRAPPQAVQVVRKIIIPEDKRQIIAAHHSTAVGHFGENYILKRFIDRNIKWEGMRAHVHEFVRRCPVCQKLSNIKVPIHTSPYTLEQHTPMTHLQIDTLGGLPPDQYGNTYIVVIIDLCTRYVTLHAGPDTSAEEAARALIAHTSIFGNPTTITSDQGSQYVNELIEDWCKLSLTDHHLNTAYSKQENAIVERANKEVMRHLRAFTMEIKTFDKWSIVLPLVQRIMNTHVHTVLGCAPTQLVVPLAPMTPSPFPHHNANVGKWSGQLIRIQQQLLQKALLLQQTITNANIVKRTPKVTLTEFPPKSMVLLSYPDSRVGKLPPTKLHPILKGPYQVISVNKDKYTLKDLNSNTTMKPVHISRLRAFHYDTERTDPAKIAQTDTHEFEVERVLDHSGDDTKRSTLDFLVRWAGYSEEYDLWLPYSELRDNIALHAYLLTQNAHLRKLIPRDLVESERKALERSTDRRARKKK